MDKTDGRVISNFVNQALKNIDITLWRWISDQSFCYISDQIRGLYSLMNNNFIGPINIGNPNEITVKEVAENYKFNRI